jgi:hypothetical protein
LFRSARKKVAIPERPSFLRKYFILAHVVGPNFGLRPPKRIVLLLAAWDYELPALRLVECR